MFLCKVEFGKFICILSHPAQIQSSEHFMAQGGVAAFHRQDVIKILIGLRIEKRLQQQMAFQDLTLLFKTLDAHIRQLNDQPVIGDRTAGYGQDGQAADRG